MLAILTVTVAACQDKTPEEQALRPMSEVRIEDHILTWDEVDGAALYMLKVMFDQYNGYEVPVYGTRYSLALYEEGTYLIQVRPVFDDGFGAYSPTITYTLQEEVVVTPSDDGKVVLRGAGTYEDPILLYTREELATLTDGKRQMTENGETVKVQNYYRLMADIDLTGEEWTSLASSTARFEGILDGNGHTIKGLKQTKLDNKTSRQNGGLFAELGKATIVNLTLEDVDISIGLNTDDFRIGGIAGYSAGATIENCKVSGSIKVASPQSTQKAAYVGMLLGYSNGTAIRRVEVAGTINATYAKVYGGGVAGICTSSSNDSITDVVSYVDVTTHGTGRDGNTAAGRSYAAGIAYISNASSIANVVWLGKAKATAIVGTPVGEEYYAEGMYVVGGSKVVNKQCQATLEDCYFAVDAVAVSEDYAEDKYAGKAAWLAAVADRYCVGNAEKQKRTSSVYCVDEETRTQQSAYSPVEGGVTFGLDFDTVWTMTDDQDKPLALLPYRSEWYEVRFVLDDGMVVSTQRVLKGQTANTPEYVGEEGYAVKWDWDAATPITTDMIVHLKHENNE